MEEEYIDYSCSTQTERLSRDIETTLRAWHISNNDRHIVISPTHPMAPRSISEPDLSHLLQNSSNQAHDDDCVKSSLINPKNKSLKHASSARSLQSHREHLLRQKTIASQSNSYVLSLLDGPLPSPNDNLESKHNDDHNGNLPLSLYPRRPYHPMPHLTTLSALFGIGQFLTLTTAAQSQKQSSASSSLAELQMALNIACHNCHCRIPAFAMHPRHHLVSGYCNPGPETSSPLGTFQCQATSSILSPDNLPLVLREFCRSSVSSGDAKNDRLLYSAARHSYHWNKSPDRPFRPVVAAVPGSSSRRRRHSSSR
eukprot:CAMPEP_0172513140 /NCGR_PEP_ID=MMETSP1066-20121228/250047_1 /TAXON_ID=671091 /ORGANISM="Coscinodiscus wailesii, Strain CCMP2513" /LENGTH=311 /DNA_ID=CAMNT_0013293263 /DNA_START=66 /DNA_END=998 /DNA_ORIENTATION=-